MEQVTENVDELHWFKSSYSGSGGGDCVEVAAGHGNNRAHEIGTAMGALNGIGADVYKDKEDDKVHWAEETGTYSAIGANGLIGEIPIVGTVGGALIDSVEHNWTKDVTDAAEEQGKQDGSKNYSKGKDGTNMLMDKWGEENGILDMGAHRTAQDQANLGHSGGRASATAHLG